MLAFSNLVTDQNLGLCCNRAQMAIAFTLWRGMVLPVVHRRAGFLQI